MEFWVVQRHLPLLLEGVKNTLILAAAGISGGIILGLFVAIAQMSKIRFVRWLAVIYKEIFRCAPLIVMIIWLYYCLPALFDIRLSAMWATVPCCSVKWHGLRMAHLCLTGTASISTTHSSRAAT